MRSLILTFLFFTFTFYVKAQQITCSPKDKALVLEKINTLKGQNISTSDFGTTIVSVGKTFLGTPYVAKTLEKGAKESLVINLRGLDCTTFVENVLAFSLMLKNNKLTYEDYLDYLETIRYKNGMLNGYSSRLHYFTEWISDNEKKGFLKNISGDIGGLQKRKEINFMSTHRTLYPFLSSDENYQGILDSETYMSNLDICYLPNDLIEGSENQIKSGDIIALTTTIKGLDVTHTGIATKTSDNRIHLLHASTKGSVEISELPLVEYLKGIKSNNGIIVCRPN